MKDYSLNDDDSKKFILSYKIENGEIVAKLASGELYTIPYSEENENEIISRMEEQAERAQPTPFKPFEIICAILESTTLPFAISNFVNNVRLSNGIVLTGVVIGTIETSIRVIIYAIEKRDIEKLNYFLDNKEELNKIAVKLTSENMKLGVSKKAVSEIELQRSEKKPPFTINNIDIYSLSDLKAVRANAERILTFGFNEEPILNNREEQGPVLKKVPNCKKNSL